jgi:radical SAM superfamily enzyme
MYYHSCSQTHPEEEMFYSFFNRVIAHGTIVGLNVHVF